MKKWSKTGKKKKRKERWTEKQFEIVRLNNYLPYSFHSVEIEESEYGDRVAVKFLVEDRAMHREIDNTSLKKMSAIILALVPDVDAVSSIIFDKYSQDVNNWDTSFYSNYISRKELSSMMDFEIFTEEYIKKSTLSVGKFEEYCTNLSSINTSYDMDDYIKQMYDFIGRDYEVVLNSGIGAEFLVDKEFLESSECKEINDLFSVDLEKFEGFALQLNKHSIRNFKTNEYKKYIVLHYGEGGKTTIIKQKIIDEETAGKVKLIIGKLMKKVDGMVIPNDENLTYTQVKALQYQVDNGHFPWRLHPEQVIMAFLSGQGENVNNIRLPEITNDTLKYEDGNIEMELFKPIDKSEHGIWIVRSYTKFKPGIIKNIIFYGLNGEIKKQADGWYKLSSKTNAYIYGDGLLPQSITAYFTPTGTDVEQFKKQVGYANAPFEQIPVTVNLAFSEEDTMGHLRFVFSYKDGSTAKTEYFNVLINI